MEYKYKDKYCDCQSYFTGILNVRYFTYFCTIAT